MKKDECEDKCMRIFYEHLSKRLPKLEPKWQKYPNGEYLAPDFNLPIQGKTFAVEITQFADIREFEGNQVNLRRAEPNRTKLIKGLEKEAKNQGILRGAYHIDFSLSRLVEPTAEMKHAMAIRVFEYLRRSYDQERAGPSAIKYNSKTVCYISKNNIFSNKIVLTFSDAVWAESPEVVSHVCDALKIALVRKSAILKKEGIPRPWILLFRNSYPFASADTYKKCISQCEQDGLKQFYCVFVIMPDDISFMLYSRKKEWY